MTKQQALPGFDDLDQHFVPDVIPDAQNKLSGYKLFLALFPETADATSLTAVARQLRAVHAFQAVCVRPERLHITLHAVARFEPQQPIPLDLVSAARAASNALRHTPVEVVHDRAGSFSNPGDNNPFVLRCDDRSTDAIGLLRAKLQVCLRRSGLQPQASTTPHLTLLYDRRTVDTSFVPAIRWQASRLRLVLSHRGLGHHQTIEEWRLA